VKPKKNKALEANVIPETRRKAFAVLILGGQALAFISGVLVRQRLESCQRGAPCLANPKADIAKDRRKEASHAHTQGIPEGFIERNGGNFFHRLLLC
jgi:hypothetical protein